MLPANRAWSGINLTTQPQKICVRLKPQTQHRNLTFIYFILLAKGRYFGGFCFAKTQCCLQGWALRLPTLEPRPSDEELPKRLSRQLCRCGKRGPCMEINWKKQETEEISEWREDSTEEVAAELGPANLLQVGRGGLEKDWLLSPL